MGMTKEQVKVAEDKRPYAKRRRELCGGCSHPAYEHTAKGEDPEFPEAVCTGGKVTSEHPILGDCTCREFKPTRKYEAGRHNGKRDQNKAR
jgi:hypothetical protein